MLEFLVLVAAGFLACDMSGYSEERKFYAEMNEGLAELKVELLHLEELKNNHPEKYEEALRRAEENGVFSRFEAYQKRFSESMG